MSLLECNLKILDDQRGIVYSAPYKKITFMRNKDGSGFYIEVSGYEDAGNTIPDGNIKKLFFFDEYEVDAIIDWLKSIKVLDT